MNHEQVMRQALEALATVRCDALYEQDCNVCNAEEALKAALAEPVQEPVAWGCFKDGELQSELVGTKTDVDFWVASDEPHMQGMVAGPLYTTSPQRKPLTEEKYNELLMAVSNKYPGETRHETALRYIRQAEIYETKPQQPKLTPNLYKQMSGCSVCGIVAAPNTTWGYVCPHLACPQRVTSGVAA